MSVVGEAVDEVRAALADEAADILPDLCAVSTPGAATTDDYGNTSAGAAAELSGVPCKLEALSVREMQRGGGLWANATHALTLPAIWQGSALTAQPKATITVAARPPYPARACTVVGSLLGSSDLWLRVAVEVES